MSAEREEAIRRITERTGKTREQAEAFLDVMGSAFRQRGWAEGEPLTQAEIGERVDTFLGERLPAPADTTPPPDTTRDGADRD